MTETEQTWGHDDQGVLAVFHMREELDPEQTKVMGAKVFRMAPYVKIRVPADPNSEVVERVSEQHRKRWPAAWRAFEAKQSGMVNGTPIHELTVLNRAQVATLKAAGIETVEMLASLPDSRLSMAITRDMRDRARQSLKTAPEVEQELRRENAELQAQVKNMSIRIDQLEHALALAGDDVPAKPARAKPAAKRGRRKAA